MDEKKNEKKAGRPVRRPAAFYIAIAALAVCTAGAGLLWAFSHGDPASQTAQLETAAEEETQTAPEETDTEAETGEQDIYVQLPAEDRDSFAEVESCEIVPGTGKFVLKASVENKPVSDDDYFYLFEMEMYDMALNEDGEYLACVPKSREISVEVDVKEDTYLSRLYSKFVVAVKLDGRYVPISKPYYITNPEALAFYQEEFPQQDSIKGLLVDPLKLTGTELDELGVCHAAYNIPVSNILGETTHAGYPTIYYNYDGKDYAFNGQRIAEYDHVFSILTAKGITITAILLNNKSEEHPELIHPLSRNGSGHYYAFNAAEEEGLETMAAVGAFLSQRYRDEAHGTVMNWIVGNEVNVRSDWNYMQNVDIEIYAREYANAVRVFYNSIKSNNANARVYISLDQQWDRNSIFSKNYDARDLLDSLNRIVTQEGNIDWGLAHHPYAYPLNNTSFWNSSKKIQSLVTDSEDSPIVTMENIHVVTDYMQRPELLSPKGEVRAIILSELGYSSTAGEANQAAAFAYAYYVADENPYIDALILSRETDAPEEVAQGLALGLSEESGKHKYIYDIFKEIDKTDSEKIAKFAREIIGTDLWGDISSEG